MFKIRLPLTPGNYGVCMGVASGGNNLSGFDQYVLNIINAEVLEITGHSDKPRFGGMVDLFPEHSIAIVWS